MKKILLIPLLSFAFFLATVGNAFAGNDITITCTSSNQCTKSADLPLFAEDNISPGFVVSQKIRVNNSRTDECNLNFKLQNQLIDNILSKKITVSISDQSKVWYAGNLETLFDNNNHQLGKISSESENTYTWVASFNQDAGNEFQKLNTKFNINLNFSCDQISTIPKVSILSLPTTSLLIGSSFPVEFNVSNASPNTEYYYKIYGGLSDNYDIQTINGSKLLGIGASWGSFQTVTTDSKGNLIATTAIAKIKPDSLAGTHSIQIKLGKKVNPSDFKTQITSDIKTITVTQSQNIVSNNDQPSNNNSPASQSCNDTTPTGVPKLLRIVPGNNNATLYWSEDASPLTYYLIAFGTSPNSYQYGNPNIGGLGTTSYTVNNLSSDTTYYFKIRAGNGCTPGGFSNELSVRPLGGVISQNNPPSGFQENVLGDTTENDQLNSPENIQTDNDQGEVKGETKVEYKRYIFWILVLLFFIVSYSYIVNSRKKFKSR